MKLIFCGKKGGPNQWFEVAKKAPSTFKKNFSRNGSFQLVCADKIFKMICGISFE